MASTGWIGKTLNERYEITELLGQGGMSAVYKANDPNLNRVVAVKLIHPHLAGDREFVRRFEAEAASVAQLRHPHLIQVFDFNHDADNYYIVFEFVPGETLQDRLLRLSEAGRTLSVDDAVDIAVKVADGLHYAHKKSLVHRDIKPANIMLNVQGEPIITDFGIAKIVGGTQHTATGAVLGTAKYMSPEQIKGEQIDVRTDIYALGATFFEMLAGRPPYTADSAMTLMMMHVTDPVPNVQDLRPDVPPALVSVVRKALAKDAGDRYQTADDFKAALLAAKAAPATAGATYVEPSSATEVIPPPPSGAAGAGQPPSGLPPRPTPASSSGPNWLLIGGGVIGLIVLIVAGIALFGGNGAAEETATAVAIAAVTETSEAETAATETAAALPTETATATSTPAATATATSSPTSTATATATATMEAEPTEMPTATATTYIAPTATTAPPPTATSIAPALSARINSITLDGSTYVVNYETFGYTEALPGQHVHFYWNNISQEQAGVGPSAANWYVYGGPRPFRQATTADRPGGVTAMCVLVANPDHTAVLNTGNCVNLP